MPQEMNVLCCYSCKMYQVHIVKKARKWRCKLCNAKQSIKQIYFQGSGKDCRLHVQRLNYSKANDTSFSLHPEQEDCNDSCNVTNIAQELDIDKPIENKWSKYLDSPKKESPPDVEDSPFDNICVVKDEICKTVNDNLCNFEKSADNCNFGSEDIVNETENPCSTDFNYDSNGEDKCNLQHSDKSNRDHNVANIFETYSELDSPLI